MVDRAGWEDRRALIGQFKEVLLAAAERRRERDDFVDSDVDPSGHEPGWVVYEREQMLAAVNAELGRRGITPPVLPETILRVERQAQGHSDYVAKWAIGCADIVLAAQRLWDGTLPGTVAST